MAIDAYLNGRFTRLLHEPCPFIYSPSVKPYQAYCKKRWNEPWHFGYGFYTHAERQIVINVGPRVGTLTHKLVHPMFETDFPEAPISLEEGVASLYEGFGLGKKGEIRGVKNWRLPTLMAAINHPKRREHARIDTLFGMSNKIFGATTSRSIMHSPVIICLWLEQRNLLWAFYHEWKNNLASDVTGEKSFVAVTGKSPSDSNPAFIRWLRAL